MDAKIQEENNTCMDTYMSVCVCVCVSTCVRTRVCARNIAIFRYLDIQYGKVQQTVLVENETNPLIVIACVYVIMCSLYNCAHVFVCACVCMCVCICLCVSAYICMCMCECVSEYMCCMSKLSKYFPSNLVARGLVIKN